MCVTLRNEAESEIRVCLIIVHLYWVYFQDSYVTLHQHKQQVEKIPDTANSF